MFAVHTLFAIWVLFLGGAEWLEGTALSLLVVSSWAANWTPGGIKAVIALSWIAGACWFVVGLFDADVRRWLPP